MPIKSRWTLDIPKVTVASFLFGSPDEPLSEKPAFIDAERPDKYILSRNDHRRWAKRIAAGLKAAGLKPGEPVMLYSGNTLFYPSLIMGVVMAEGIFTGANPAYTAREVAYQLENSGARFFICAEAALEVGLEAAKKAGLDKSRIFTFDDGYDTFDETGKSKMGVKHWSALIGSKAQGDSFRWREEPGMLNDTIALNYSSGTTGLPKGVEITHTNYVSNAIQQGYLTQLRSDYEQVKNNLRYLCLVPMYHAMGQTVFCCLCPHLQIPVYLMRKFDPMKMLEAVQNFRITDLILVPPIVVFMAKSPITRKYDLSSVTKGNSGAAPLGSEVTKEFESLWPPGVMNMKQGYGMTESTTSLLGWDPNKHSDSFGVGEPNANCEMKIVSPETLEEVRQGERGELWARGPNIMKGYWKNPKATKETLTEDGWLKTGDVAVVDDKGVFFIVDRIKELIKVKGNQVAPAELESQLLEHPGISDAAVIGVSIDGEEYPRAYVVKAPNQNVTAESVIKFMEERVSRHKKLVGGVKFVEAIMKNPSGKIMRRLYREEAAKESEGAGRTSKL